MPSMDALSLQAPCTSYPIYAAHAMYIISFWHSFKAGLLLCGYGSAVFPNVEK